MIFQILTTSRNWQPSRNRYFAALVLVWLVQGAVLGQIVEQAEINTPDNEDLDDITLLSEWAFKANITSFLLPQKISWMVAAEYKLAPRWTLELGAGTYLSSSYFAQKSRESYTGPRFKLAAKYFRPFNSGDALYVGLEAKYHNITNKRNVQVLRQGNQYTEILLTTRTVKTQGLALRLGGHFYVDQSRSVLLDIYNTLGFAWHKVSWPLPPDAENVADTVPSDVDWSYPIGESGRIDFTFGVLLGYSIR